MESLRTNKQVDVLVVGSGAAGSVVAAINAEAGKEVLILEAGPKRRLTDLVSSQIHARKLKWSGAFVEEQGDLKIGHNFNSGYGTGGGALHHFAVWPRLHENDFTVRSDYGKGLDWPINYKTLQPFYDRIQDEVGVSGDAVAEKWRPPGKSYPLPPLPVFAQGRVIARGFERLGIHTAPIPMAVKSQPYKGRSACLYDGWCDAGCPIGALANPLVTYLPRAMKAGASIQHDATVAKVIHDSSGTKATGVEYHDSSGALHTVYAKQVVLCAFAVQNARLLLNSASEKHPNGLANANDMVGRYLMTHPSQAVFGLMAEETQPHLGPTGGQLICHDHYANKRPSEDSFGSYQWLIANAAKPNDLLGIANSRPDIYGKALEPFMRRASKHFALMNLVGEDVALANNRVTLSANRDLNGVPLAATTHSLLPETWSMLKRGVQQGKNVFKAAGAEETWAGNPFGMHIMGGTVMGSESDSSVTDDFGRTHSVESLYLTGPGGFPSSGAVNPTFTIHALALRTAEQMLRDG